jgi:beta-galactosidase
MPRFPKIFPHHPGFAHGGDYNPDQWLDRYPDILDQDIRLMDEAGCDTFSVGIFSWARYEPREGEYHFDWMRNLLDRLHAAGKSAVLATPSGSKPAWLSHAHPEVCRVDAAGRREHHHSRHNHCFTSSIYRQKVAEMNRRLAENFGSHPAVRMWHISNEYSGECYCDLCLEAFRSWLKARYGTLEELNHAWWSHFWSHTMTDWHLIDPRDSSVDGMRLDWLRFVTHQTVDFMQAEIAALRAGGATQPVTTNMMGTFPHIDYWRFVDHVDVIADDCYPVWKHTPEDIQTAAATAMLHDMHRSMKGGRPWMLMESCTCSTQWVDVPKRKRPGVYETEMLQAVAHGADTVMYFQWRKGRGGMEKYHGAVVDHEGSSATREFRQVQSLSSRLRALSEITGCGLKPDAAILFDWEVRWAMETSDGIKRYQGDEDLYLGPVRAFHRAFWQAGIPVDVVESTVDFSGYRLVIAPQLYLLKSGVAGALMRYVEQGGTLVLTTRSGMVNPSNLCFTGGFPGEGLREFCGVWAEEMDTLYPGESQTLLMEKANPLSMEGTYTTGRIVEMLHAEDSEILATLTTDYYAGAPILTRRTRGRGTVYYLGAWMQDDFHRDFLRALQKETGIRQVIETDLPRGVSAQMRTDDTHEFIFVQNFTAAAQTVQLDSRKYTCVESGQPVSGELPLPPWSTRVLRRASGI